MESEFSIGIDAVAKDGSIHGDQRQAHVSGAINSSSSSHLAGTHPNYQLDHGSLLRGVQRGLLDGVFEDFETWLDRQLEGWCEIHAPGKWHSMWTKHKGFCPHWLTHDPFDAEGVIGNSALLPFPCQQLREEIYEFMSVLINQLSPRASILEVGLGDFGGTHILWDYIFDSVTTIDNNGRLLQQFSNNNSYRLLKEKNFLFCNDAATINHDLLESSYDVLFIDGNHAYENARADYENLAPLVREGGIVGFHDTRCPEFGSAKFVRDLGSTTNYDIKHIHPEGLGAVWAGISYFMKTTPPGQI
jgi:hypothetical protein